MGEPYTESIPQSAYAVEYRYLKISSESTPRPTAVIPSISSPSVWTDTKTGEKNPKWRSQIRRGINATTEYSTVTRKLNVLNGSGMVWYHGPAGQVGYRGYDGHPQSIGWGAGSPAGLQSDLADRLAREQFVEHYRKRRTAFTGGIFLAELREAVAMIRRPASALRDGIDRYYGAAMERYRRAKYKRFVIQDTWLEWSFGWSPLIGDIKDLCKVATASPSRASQPIHDFSVDEQFRDHQELEFVNPPAFGQLYTRVLERNVRVDYKGAADCQNNPPGFPEQLGFSWSNVAPTIWEVIPWSFLFDYFTNIGKIVEGMSTGTITLRWGYRAVTKTSKISIIDRGLNVKRMVDNCPSGWTYDGRASLAGELETWVSYHREPITGVSYGLRDFHWQFPTDAKKWLNIAALLPMRFLRKEPISK